MFLHWLLSALVASGAAVKQDKDYWMNVGKRELMESLELKWNTRVAKNVIVFIGDGMGVNTITASRIYRAGEESRLYFESFPHIATLKTYSANKQVPDSASTATALFCGVKNNYETLGVDSNVHLDDCDASLVPENRLLSIMSQGQQAGKATGIVTTTRITHATPAATYAACANRQWECEANIPGNIKLCKDIARQLVEDTPGRNFNVILGGGRQCLVSDSSALPGDPIDKLACIRKDGLDMIKQWALDKRREGLKYAVATQISHLTSLDTDNTTHLLGIFTNSHFPAEYLRNKSPSGVPSLSLMTTTAIKTLKKNNNGFFLMVEGGMIDQAHHNGTARVALDEVIQLNRAVNDTMKLLNSLNIIDDTLVIVTSDHGHTLSINGYPKKGSDILGIGATSKVDGVPWTTLTYGVATKYNYQYTVNSEGKVERQDPRKMDTRAYSFRQLSALPHDISSHGGGDVLLFATGPMAHLFHGVHEQNFVAHGITYAARIGDYADRPIQSSSVTLKVSLIIFSLYFLISL